MKNYHQKTALITGASSGIGEAFAECLAEQGAHLILTARRHDRLATLADRLRHHGANVTVIVDDLMDPAAPGRLHDEIETRGLTVDLLVNNAGFGSGRRFDEDDRTRLEDMVDLNVRALVALTRLFLPAMRARREGGVINVASTAAFQPVPFMATYGATKAFVLSFSEALWAECEPVGVGVLALCPGYTTSEFHAIAGSRVDGIAMVPARRVAEEGLRALLDRKCYHVVGAGNYVVAQTPRFFPRHTTARIVRGMFAKRVSAGSAGA
ncbi:MAG TPA: SDR family oxidoreductase [Opitutaceae bacterium]